MRITQAQKERIASSAAHDKISGLESCYRRVVEINADGYHGKLTAGKPSYRFESPNDGDLVGSLICRELGIEETEEAWYGAVSETACATIKKMAWKKVVCDLGFMQTMSRKPKYAAKYEWLTGVVQMWEEQDQLEVSRDFLFGDEARRRPSLSDYLGRKHNPKQ